MKIFFRLLTEEPPLRAKGEVLRSSFKLGCAARNAVGWGGGALSFGEEQEAEHSATRKRESLVFIEVGECRGDRIPALVFYDEWSSGHVKAYFTGMIARGRAEPHGD